MNPGNKKRINAATKNQYLIAWSLLFFPFLVADIWKKEISMTEKKNPRKKEKICRTELFPIPQHKELSITKRQNNIQERKEKINITELFPIPQNIYN